MYLLKKFSIPWNSCIFYYWMVVEVFGLHLCEILKKVLCFFSTICPRNITRVRKKCNSSGAVFMFSCNNENNELFSKTMNILPFVCDCRNTSSKYVIAFLFYMSGWKTLP